VNVRTARSDSGISPKSRLDLFSFVDRRSMVDDCSYRQTRRKLGDSAHVIDVKMGHDERVDLSHSGSPRDLGNSIGISPA
jgi:hypothetical protein